MGVEHVNSPRTTDSLWASLLYFPTPVAPLLFFARASTHVPPNLLNLEALW